MLQGCRRKTSDAHVMCHALFSRNGGVAECGWNIPLTREVCSRDPEEVQDDGLQGHDHTYGIEHEVVE